MTQIRLASTHDLFINGLVMSGSGVVLRLRIVSNFATPNWNNIVKLMNNTKKCNETYE